MGDLYDLLRLTTVTWFCVLIKACRGTLHAHDLQGCTHLRDIGYYLGRTMNDCYSCKAPLLMSALEVACIKLIMIMLK
jgi:hypothetical protein